MKLAKIDMKPLYKLMLTQPDKEFPEVIIVEETESGNICDVKKLDNINLVYLKKNSTEKIFEIINNIETYKSKILLPALPFEDIALTSEDYLSYIKCAVTISDALEIPCPQIMFTKMSLGEGGNWCGTGLIALADYPLDIDIKSYAENFKALAHELRHEWQHIYHPDWFQDYPMMKSVLTQEDNYAYCSHKTEIDAEAFAIKVASIVIPGSKICNTSQAIIDKYLSRANEIEIPEKHTENLKKLLR